MNSRNSSPDRVSRALRAIHEIQPRSGWPVVSLDADKLRRILKSRVRSKAHEDALLERTHIACEDLEINRALISEFRRNDTVNKLRVLQSSAEILAQHWSMGDLTLRKSLRIWLRRDPSQFERIDGFLRSDLRHLVSLIDEKVAALDAAKKVKKLPEYLCAMQIAKAWYENTGELATLTRNKEAVSGPQVSPFERYLRAVVPPPAIGSAIVRQVIEKFKREMSGV